MFNRNIINNSFTQHKRSELNSKVKIKCLQCNTQWIRIEFLHKLEGVKIINAHFHNTFPLQISPTTRLLSPPLKEIAADRDIARESEAHGDYVTSFISE